VLTFFACVLMAQAPPQKTAVVQGGNVGVSTKRLGELNRGLVELLKAPWLEPVASKSPCESRDCVLAAGKALDAKVVVSVAFALVGKETVVDIEALQGSDGRSLATATFTLGAGKLLSAPDLAGFLKQLKDALGTPLKEAPAEEPLKSAEPAPADTAVRPPKVAVAQSSSSFVVPVTLGAGTLVAGAIAGVLGFEGVTAHASLDAQIRATGSNGYADITMDHAQQTLAPANNLFTGSLITGCVAGALAVLAIVLFLIN
jgi:hypothetical protein